MKLKFKFYFTILLLVTDLIAINLVYISSISVLQYFSKISIKEDYFSLLFIYNIFWFGPAGFFSLYRINKSFLIDDVHRSTWKTIFFHQIILIVFLLFDNKTAFTKDFIIIEFSLIIVALLASRFIYTFVFYTLGGRIYNSKKTYIIGNNTIGIKLAHLFESKPLEYIFAGFLDKQSESEIQSLEKIESYFNKAYEQGIENIYLIISRGFNLDSTSLFNISEKYGIKLKLVNDIDNNHFSKFVVKIEDGFEFYSYRSEKLEQTSERVKKRIFDIVFSSLVIVFILSWLYPIIAILIKMESRGPVIFKQTRNGRSYRPFYCFKFRSMFVDNPDASKQATKNDPRVTKIGAFMRRTSIDELPQFFNVLIGEMSVVGPRPHMTIQNDSYKKIIDTYLVRSFIKPGITGWAQVSGFRGETKELALMEKRVLKDIEYLENWTLMFDIRIIFLTIYTTIKGDKNAF